MPGMICSIAYKENRRQSILFQFLNFYAHPTKLKTGGLCSQSIVTTNYVCPKKFNPIGRKCYHFAKDEATWHDAHFKCLNLNSTLATVTRSHQELLIRQYLHRHSDVLGKYERWLGGMFNEKQSKWIWGATGRPLIFHGFSRMNANDKTKWIWHCIIIDPMRQNKWGARSCLHKKHYVCQTPTNKYMSIKKELKEDFDKHGCDLEKLEGYEKELCSKLKYGDSAPGYLVQNPHKKKKKRLKPIQYKDFICPEHMILVGRKCYFFGTDSVNWNDAYWACRDNKTKLATINTRLQDSILRGFLNGNFIEKHERWIGGIFDWKQNKWKWAMNGQELKYKNFARSAIGVQDQAQHCITMDPRVKHLWMSVNRLESRNYICQSKPKTLIKYEKPSKFIPDATVVIKIENNTDDLKNSSRYAYTTEGSVQGYYNNNIDNASTEKYIFN